MIPLSRPPPSPAPLAGQPLSTPKVFLTFLAQSLIKSRHYPQSASSLLENANRTKAQSNPMCTSCQLPTQKNTPSDTFADRMLDMLNQGALVTMISVGHRTGLFDTLSQLPPSTSQTIAKAAQLQERYVREWLGAMVTGRVIEFDAPTQLYHLPETHAAVLTRKAAPDNLAAFAQYIPLFGTVEDGIVQCFHEGGGLPYSAFPRFQDVMAEDSGQTVLPALIEEILPIVPGILERLEAGIDVLDIGFGQGKALNLMAQTFPKSRFTGYEISEEGIAFAQSQAQDLGLNNIEFLLHDAKQPGRENAFDLICTFDAVHDQAHPDALLQNIHRSLRAGGFYLMQDIDASSNLAGNLNHPMGTLLYTISTMHCMTVSLAEGGEGLGTMWGVDVALKRLQQAGFNHTVIHRLPHDVQNAYLVSTK